MISCPEAAAAISLYVDNELAPEQVAELEAHFEDCRDCRIEYEQLRAVSDNVRAATPLFEPSEESARRVRTLVEASARAHFRKRLLAMAAALAVLVIMPAIWLWLHESAGFSEFAAGSHIRYANGSTPLDIQSDEPETVSRWFSGRLPFHFRLPRYVNEPDGPQRYSLVGARLLQYRNSDVAYLAYNMNRRPISLLVASADRVLPGGGQTFRTGGIDFHFTSDRGLRLITWRDKGLSYALVSDVNVSGAQSCVICHGSAADRRKIEAFPR